MGLLGRVFVLINYKSLHSIWPEPFRVGASDFLSLKVKRLSNQFDSETWPCLSRHFCSSSFYRLKKMNDDYLTILFLILSALCTIVCLWLDNQRIKACRQVWILYALPSALVAGGSVLSQHGGEGLSGTGGRFFGCSDYFYALPMPLNLPAQCVCRPRYEVVQIVHTSVQTVQTSADKSAECRQ